MIEALKIMFWVAIFGGISSGIGGLISSVIKVKSNNKVASLFEITAGIMTSIVCFDMLPECFELASGYINISGILLGIGIVFCINLLLEKSHKDKFEVMTLTVMLSMGIHNAIEGLAIGSALSYSFSLGLSLIISIFLHDIPEGMVVGITNKASKFSFKKTLFNSIIVGLFTGIGGFFGAAIGNISNELVALNLSIAAGAMLYIVSCDLIPSSKSISNNKYVSFMYIFGIIIGVIITKI